MAAKPHDLHKIRNIGVIAHIDAGKTTTTEHLLYYAGAVHKLGGVDEGTTKTDYDEEEQDRGITIYSACIPLDWNGHTINLIDTPGHVDFTAEVERSLRVLDGCVCVFDAQKGVEAQSEKVWQQANKYAVPRLVFVNKMDVVGANFANVLAEVRERLEGNPVAIVIPIGAGSIKDSNRPFEAVIDLLAMESLYFTPPDGKLIDRRPVPDDMLDEATTYRNKLIDVLTEHDENDLITSAVLEGQTLEVAKIKRLIREQTLKRLIQPVLCGSGRDHTGIQPILDAVIDYLPTPLDRPAVVGQNPKRDGKEEKRKPDVKEPFCGLVFKVVSHPNGERFFVRVYSGVLKPNSRALNPTRDMKELVPKLYRVHADPMRGLEEVPEAPAGDIVAIVGLRESITGDTLCETQHPIVLEAITFAEAVVSQSVEPESGADKQKLIDTLTMLGREDPTFRWKVDPETGQTLMSGMGMLHLEVKRNRMKRDFRLNVRVGKPRVSYRESMRQSVTVTGEAPKNIGNPQFAKITVAFNKTTGDWPNSVANRLDETQLPPPLAAAAERALKDAIGSGELGYPVLNVQAVIEAAEFDPALSTEAAFAAAATDAARKAYNGNMLALEPIMKLEVLTPEEALGAVTGDLNARRAEIEATAPRGKWWVIDARVPLVRMFDYADRLRSLSQGRASSSMEPLTYAPASEEFQRHLYLGEDL